MDDEVDYEKLDGVGVVGSMVAGAVAGTAEHIIMYPVDSVKTRMQALHCEKKLAKGIFNNVYNMMKEEGALRPMRGATVVITGSGPAHALYFTSYEQVKKVFFGSKVSKYLPETVGHGAAGFVATLFHDAVMTPAEAVKQRMQMCCSKYTRWSHCAKNMYREEGGRAFFRAYYTQLGMNLPYQICQFMGYEYCKKILNPDGKYDLRSHLLSGAIAGAVAASITNPMDVCKTLLNTQEPELLRELKTKRIDNFGQAARTVFHVAGPAGFFKGLTARVMFQAPSTSICWATYEGLKHLLSLRQNLEDKYDTLSDLSAPGRSPSHTAVPAIATTNPAALENTGGGGGAGNQSAGAPRGAAGDKLLTITDLPRPLRALSWPENETRPETPLTYSDNKFSSTIRTD